MFVYRSPEDHAIHAIVIMRVDDFLITSTPLGLGKFKEAMSISKWGINGFIDFFVVGLHWGSIWLFILTVLSECRKPISHHA